MMLVVKKYKFLNNKTHKCINIMEVYCRLYFLDVIIVFGFRLKNINYCDLFIGDNIGFIYA